MDLGFWYVKMHNMAYDIQLVVFPNNMVLLFGFSLIPCGVMYNDHFHTFHFAKNYIPIHILMLVVHGEMGIYLPSCKSNSNKNNNRCFSCHPFPLFLEVLSGVVCMIGPVFSPVVSPVQCRRCGSCSPDSSADRGGRVRTCHSGGGDVNVRGRSNST